MTSDVIIVGSGIAGAALAYYLSGEGLEVELVDKDYPGLGASGKSAGILTVQHWNRVDITLARRTMDLCNDLSDDEKRLSTPAGLLRATTREEDVGLMEERAAMYREKGSEAEFLDPSRMRERWPHLNTGDLKAGLYTPRDAYVDAYDLTTKLVALAKERGAIVRMATMVAGIDSKASRVTGLKSSKGRLASKVVVVAAGAWSGSILRTCGVTVPLKPYRTQALSTAPLQSLPNLPMFHELPAGLYFRPDRDGLLLGDGTELRETDPAHYNTHADFDLHAELAAWIASRTPGLGDVRFARGWAGVCVATPDRFPLVGPLSDVDGLYVLSGFNGMGIMRSPPLARALADQLLGRDPAIDLEPFRPDRFGQDIDFPIMEGFTLHDTEFLKRG